MTRKSKAMLKNMFIENCNKGTYKKIKLINAA
jgi:hypothetical protein